MGKDVKYDLDKLISKTRDLDLSSSDKSREAVSVTIDPISLNGIIEAIKSIEETGRFVTTIYAPAAFYAALRITFFGSPYGNCPVKFEIDPNRYKNYMGKLNICGFDVNLYLDNGSATEVWFEATPLS